MVYVQPSTNTDADDCLTAYLVTNLTDHELKTFKSAFELGACSRFSPLLHLKIARAPEDYWGKTHQYIRSQEDKAGREESFGLIDDEAKERGAIWYIDRFFDEDDVENELAVSTDVVMKILLKTEAFALSHVNYVIANMTIFEDLDNCGVDSPITNDFKQPELDDCGGMDFEDQQWYQDVWVTAEPGEFEESTDPKHLDNFSPRPDKVARLKKDVAQAVGIVSDWTFIGDAEPIDLDNGEKKEFPPGSVVLQQRYNPDFAWPEYKWPEGSL
ncbi:hypothetical protein QYS62_000097 [Fusarium acuminatum]|uniref:Uncharacterized protein n=1 Tax=Fusarium acuminatum TaxID=5515 RepID=A0ABZ2WF62_9HYPO